MLVSSTSTWSLYALQGYVCPQERAQIAAKLLARRRVAHPWIQDQAGVRNASGVCFALCHVVPHLMCMLPQPTSRNTPNSTSSPHDDERDTGPHGAAAHLL
ncbi:MAG: hypothetical protein HC828_06885, partial [Blastochloris sp.]|nr:hypothetical protein [Blastochloris sp.]